MFHCPIGVRHQRTGSPHPELIQESLRESIAGSAFPQEARKLAPIHHVNPREQCFLAGPVAGEVRGIPPGQIPADAVALGAFRRGVPPLRVRGGAEGSSSEITTSRSPPARRTGRTRSPPSRASSSADFTAVLPVLQLTTRLQPTCVFRTSANGTPQRARYSASFRLGAADTVTRMSRPPSWRRARRRVESRLR